MPKHVFAGRNTQQARHVELIALDNRELKLQKARKSKKSMRLLNNKSQNVCAKSKSNLLVW